MGCDTCGEPGFDCHDATTESRIEASAEALTRDLKAFLNSTGTSRVAGGNMSVPRNPQSSQTAQARAAEVAMQAAREEIKDTEQHLLVDESDRRQKNVDSGKVLAGLPAVVLSGGLPEATVPVPQNRSTPLSRIRSPLNPLFPCECPSPDDPSRAFQVAIVFTSDGMRTFYEKWAGTSKERRRWTAETLREWARPKLLNKMQASGDLETGGNS
jgi:hypothetical protein